MNKKQIIVTFILAILMVLLLFVEKFFDNKFKNITIMNNNMGSLKEYYMNKGEFSYSLPGSWDMNEITTGNCNIYKVEFKDSTNNIIGSIEILNNNDDVNTIAEIDMKNMILEKSEEDIKNFKIGDNRGIKVKYKTKINRGYNYINSCYYVSVNNNEKIKVTFIVKEDNYNDNMAAVFDTIVGSINK